MISFKNIPDGHAHPLGATCYEEGVNFSIFSKHAEKVELWLFDHPGDHEPSRIINLRQSQNRTFYYWHIFVEGIGAGQLYGYKVYGPSGTERGFRFDGAKLLIDPYARAVANLNNYDRQRARLPGDNTGNMIKSVVIDPARFNWEGDQPINRPYATTVIYEMHVKGMTAHPSADVDDRIAGTYKGLLEKIPYLQELGITAVELMPVQQFDPQDAMPGLSNYWGYSPINFFSPHAGFSSVSDPQAICDEFREMVKAFHQAGIEVILDVVFNHSAEGAEDGPTLSFRGIENKAYYMLDGNQAKYKDFTGCGNTINSNHSIVRRMICDSLRAWVTEYHIDGFRFDLASVLSRDENGEPLSNPPLLWEIESDPVLAGTKIIAEAWDAAGLYQVGSFIGDRWAEWNGKYRDDVRKFLRGDNGVVTKLASRITGSPDIYMSPNREPNRSIHFVTCHDGFTLRDLVSYSKKYNKANGENNRDGDNENFSWNCGAEGPTDKVEVNALRWRQMKNFMALTFLSQGTPMILMGDEMGRTQQGNNNAYCQDNEISWVNWDLLSENEAYNAFVKRMINYSQSKSLFRIEHLLAANGDNNIPYIKWHGVKLDKPDWAKNSHSLAFTLHHPQAHETIHVMLNAFWEPLSFEVPPTEQGHTWKKVIDTFAKSPDDMVAISNAQVVENSTLQVHQYSIMVLELQ